MPEKNDRKYEFSWELLGDLELGRPNLGNNVSIEMYRLLQFTLRDIIEDTVGTEETDKIFYRAGKMAGEEFYKHHVQPTEDINEFIKQLEVLLLELGIGIFRVEEMDMDRGELVLTVAEDLDCSGLPEIGNEVCIYDGGFISGLLECFSGVPFQVKEVDCWCTGDRTCRFVAKII